MLSDLLPDRIDNTYRGHPLALWLLALVAFLKALQSVAVITSGRSIALGADGIPIEAYPAEAAQTVLALFALVGLARLILALLSALVLVRYRSAVPFMCALLALEYLAKQATLHFVPFVRTGAPVGPTVNLVLFGLTVVGLALSLRRRGGARSAGGPAVAS